MNSPTQLESNMSISSETSEDKIELIVQKLSFNFVMVHCKTENEDHY